MPKLKAAELVKQKKSALLDSLKAEKKELANVRRSPLRAPPSAAAATNTPLPPPLHHATLPTPRSCAWQRLAAARPRR
jgi:hypothetical protein